MNNNRSVRTIGSNFSIISSNTHPHTTRAAPKSFSTDKSSSSDKNQKPLHVPQTSILHKKCFADRSNTRKRFAYFEHYTRNTFFILYVHSVRWTRRRATTAVVLVIETTLTCGCESAADGTPRTPLPHTHHSERMHNLRLQRTNVWISHPDLGWTRKHRQQSVRSAHEKKKICTTNSNHQQAKKNGCRNRVIFIINKWEKIHSSTHHCRPAWCKAYLPRGLRVLSSTCTQPKTSIT